MEELVRKVGGQWQPLAPFAHNGTAYGPAWFDAAGWPDADARAAEMSRLGVAVAAPIGERPADMRVLGQTIADVDGVPHRVWSAVAYGLDEAREIVWERVKALREAKANGGALTPFDGKRADSDSESRLRISGAVQLADKAAAAGVPFTIAWTMADNSLVPLDAAGMSALGIAVGQHYAACYTRAQQLRGDIATSDDPFTIDIDAGWPA